MHSQDTITQDMLPQNRLPDLEELTRQHADAACNASLPEQMNPSQVDNVLCVCLRPHTDFFVEPSQSDQLTRLQQDSSGNPGGESLPTEQPRSALLDQDQSYAAKPSDAEFLMAGHWQCQICGARHLGLLPATCEACGADGHYLEYLQEIRQEMTFR